MRWDGDYRGGGVADAAWLVPGASQMIDAFSASAWVAEAPDDHLRPHIDDWSQRDGRLAVTDAQTDDSGTYILDLQWRGAPAGIGHARAAVFALVGSFAESATYVRQRRIADGGEHGTDRLRFEIGTGEVAPDARFAPHGHAVVINLAGAL